MENKENILYFVTGNTYKFHEISILFEEANINYTLKQSKVMPTEIQANNIKAVALFKLNSIKEQIHTSYFIEDAGFFVDTPLNGFPGVYSSYVMKTIGNEGIINLIDNFNETQAHFTSVIALYFKPLDKNYYFEGNVYGKVSKTIRGSSGFGFDPIFLPNALPNKTFAELTVKEKNRISHRGIAWNKFIKFLRENK